MSSYHKAKPRVKAIVFDTPSHRIILVKGKRARVLDALVRKGRGGITALELSNTWALRLSEYISVLRHEYGLDIETVKEPQHDGWHGRYILRIKVTITDKLNF